MGWGGPFLVDGREVGYAVEAKCDDEGCSAQIDRGLGYICGTMHGETEPWGCANYYCTAHIAQWSHDCQGVYVGCDHEFTPDEDDPYECGFQDGSLIPDGSPIYCGYPKSAHEWTDPLSASADPDVSQRVGD